MKRVSFKVAKALKEAGYPQDEYGHHYYLNGVSCYGVLEDNNIYAPTYIEVWLWLCNIVTMYPVYNRFRKGWSCEYCSETRIFDADTFGISDNPEDAIIVAIEYLVDTDDWLYVGYKIRKQNE